MKTLDLTIEQSQYENFINRIERFNRRCVKLNVPNLVLVEGEKFDHKVYYDTGRVKVSKLQYMTVTIPDLRLSTDWELIGMIETNSLRVNDMVFNIVKPLNDVDTIDEYAIGDFGCDHCHREMTRTKLLVVKNISTNERKLVGSSCVKDFIGHNIEGALFLAGITTESFGAYYDEERVALTFGLKYIVQQSVGAIIYDGGKYVSKKSLRDGKSEYTTCGIVEGNIAKCSSFNENDPPYDYDSDVVMKEVDLIMEELKALSETLVNGIDNSYSRNVAIMVARDFVCPHEIGYIVSYVGKWWIDNKGVTKDTSSIFYYDPKQSEYIGAVGDKLELLIEVEKVTESKSDFGGFLIFGHQMFTNNRFMLYSSKQNDLFTYDGTTIRWKDKTIYKIRATVKSVSEHEKYGKSTMLTRAKVLPIVLPK